MSLPLRRRPGFTLIEVMVVCATIAVVLIVLAPAIRQARERANSLRCRNNLKTLGLALVNYEATFQAYPPGYIAAIKTPPVDGSRDLNWNSGWGWQTFFLPFFDQAPLYNQIVSKFETGLPTDVGKLTTAKIPAFRCPDDRGSAIVAKVKVLGPLPVGRKTTVVDKGFARSNYVGIAGWDNDWHLGMTAKENPNAAVDKAASNWSKLKLGADFKDGTAVYAGSLKINDKHRCPNASDFHGLFGENSHRKLDQLTDGVSNCFAIGERATPTANGAATDVGNVIWAGVPDRSTRVGQALSLGSAYWEINFELKDHTVPNTTGFNSRHGGGANFLVADGAVRSVSEKLDLALLRRLAVVDDGDNSEIEILPPQ